MRKIIHIDMDCFFAAIEMRDHQILPHIPLAVGGRSNRGVICSANYSARQLGIKNAMSSQRALNLCPQLYLIEPRHTHYKSISEIIMSIFRRYSDKVEPVALDEAYLDVSNSLIFQGSGTLIAQQIRTEIQSVLHLTASAGVAPNKFLAKLASSQNKPNGLFVIPPTQVVHFIEGIHLSQIPGVGKVTRQKLRQLGINSCRDVLETPWQKLQPKLGKFAFELHERCRGIDNREVESARYSRSIGVERTLSEDLRDISQLQPIFNKLFEILKSRLLQSRVDLRIAKQGVKLKFSDFQLSSKEQTCGFLDEGSLWALLLELYSKKLGMRGVRLVGLYIILVHPQLDKQLHLTW